MPTRKGLVAPAGEDFIRKQSVRCLCLFRCFYIVNMEIHCIISELVRLCLQCWATKTCSGLDFFFVLCVFESVKLWKLLLQKVYSCLNLRRSIRISVLSPQSILPKLSLLALYQTDICSCLRMCSYSSALNENTSSVR